MEGRGLPYSSPAARQVQPISKTPGERYSPLHGARRSGDSMGRPLERHFGGGSYGHPNEELGHLGKGIGTGDGSRNIKPDPADIDRESGSEGGLGREGDVSLNAMLRGLQDS